MLTWILAAAAIICLAYFGVIVGYAGPGTSWCGLWLLAGLFLLAAAAAVFITRRAPKRLPLWLPVSMVTLAAAGLVILLAAQVLILTQVPSVAAAGLDYVIVLGAKVKPSGLSRTLALRLDKAAEYAAENPATIFILTGGQGPDEPTTEAEAMRGYLVAAGVDEERLVLETASRNTVENIRNSRALIAAREGDAVISVQAAVLTSNFHLCRARLIAVHQGMENVRGIAAESDPVLFVHYCMRDGLALLKDRLLGNL